ncbi:MAG: ShlB/FhaC/HecB family hemolysin secretion/activation protein [Cyanobacteria bacterium P01_D01_bin.73]
MVTPGTSTQSYAQDLSPARHFISSRFTSKLLLKSLSNLTAAGLLALVGIGAEFHNSAQAQLDPLPDNRPPAEPSPLPPLDEILPQTPQTPDPPNPARPPVDGSGEAVFIRGYRFEGNTVFSDEELSELLKDYQNRELRFEEVLEARTKITEHYIKAGYTTSGAYVPLQTITDGVVLLQILEGRLEALEIVGLERLQDGYVRSRLRQAVQAPLNTNRVLEALQLLQLDPLIEKISAELSAGLRPGENLLRVDLTEANPLDLELSTDNGRSPSVGSTRLQVTGTHGNLLGWGDRLEVGYTYTQGSDAWDVSYEVPINGMDGTIALRAALNSSEVIEEPFNALDIQAESRQFNLTYRQPVFRKPDRELALGISLSHLRSETQLLGEDFPLSPGANDDGETRLTTVGLFQEWTKRDTEQVFALRSQFTWGLDALDATVRRESPDAQFFSWQGQAQWVRQLGRDSLFLLRGDIQLADRPLVPLEQFSVGGPFSVRGYRQDQLLTDSGFLVSAELRLPIWRVSEADLEGGGVLQVIPFFDVGKGWNLGDDRPDPNPDVLLGAGLGLRWQQGNFLTIRLDYGIPLTDVDIVRDTWQENGIYFSVQWRPQIFKSRESDEPQDAR